MKVAERLVPYIPLGFGVGDGLVDQPGFQPSSRLHALDL
jgi:hypothetical protein